MTDDLALALWISVPVFLILMFFAVLSIVLYERKHYPKNKTGDIIELQKAIFLPAKALRKRINMQRESIKLPRLQLSFFVTFLLETGEEKEYELSQEAFEKIEEGKQATLVLVNGLFFDFGDGEEI